MVAQHQRSCEAMAEETMAALAGAAADANQQHAIGPKCRPACREAWWSGGSAHQGISSRSHQPEHHYASALN